MNHSQLSRELKAFVLLNQKGKYSEHKTQWSLLFMLSCWNCNKMFLMEVKKNIYVAYKRIREKDFTEVTIPQVER